MRRLAFAALLAFAFTAAAAEFGPQTFHRTAGAPQTIIETFDRRVAAGRYELVLTSRDVSAAWIWLNGAPVFTSSDFSQQVVSLRKAVSLVEGRNELRVQLAGAPGGEITIRISSMLAAAGGTISIVNGPSFTIPPGALSGDAEADLRSIPLGELDAPHPAGFAILGAVALDLGGATLAVPGALAIPIAAQTLRRPIVSRVIPLESAPRLMLIDTASLSDGRLHTNSPPFTGVRVEGTYVFMDMPSELGIAGFQVPRSGTWIALLQSPAFLGMSDANGPAVIPGVVPQSRVTAIATMPEAVSLASFDIPSLPDIIADGFAPAWLNEWLLENAYDIDPNELPPQPGPCACTALTVDPPHIPRTPGTVFAPQDAEQLRVTCGADDMTDRVQLDIPDLLHGAAAGITLYDSDASVVSVSPTGLVRGEAPGFTFIGIANWTVQLHTAQIDGAGVVLPFICPAFGRVDPVTVTCPAGAPHWDAAEHRCEAQIAVSVVGNGSGSVDSSPAGIANCRSTCTATFPPGTNILFAATPDPGSIVSWSPSCAAGAFVAQEGATCAVSFTKKPGYRAYVTNFGGSSGTVSIIDTETDTVIGTITGLPLQAFKSAECGDPKRIYVAYGSGALTAINTLTKSVVAQRSGLAPAFEMACVASRLYVRGSTFDTVLVFDPVSLAPLPNLIVPAGTIDNIVRAVDGSLMVTGNRFGIGTTYIFGVDGRTRIVHHHGTRAVATPDLLKLFASGGGLPIEVMDVDTDSVITTIPAGNDPTWSVMRTDGAKVYVSNRLSANVTVIDAPSNTAIATVPVGSLPWDLAITPDGKKVYVPNRFGNSVSVIDTATNTVIKTISVGTQPTSVLIADPP